MHVKEAARQGMWATSLDFSDAYHHVPIHPDTGVLLSRTTPQEPGPTIRLSSAPWVFIEVVKQIRVCSVAKVRLLFQYLDDCFNLFKGYDEALCGTKELQGVCTTLGLLINQNAIYSLPRRVPGFH